MHVQVQNVGSNGLVKSIFSDVLYNENGVESRQDGTLEINLFSSMLQIIVSTEHWVSSGQD